MVSRTLLSVVGITVWAAVLVTAAPRVISHRYSEHTVEVSARSIPRTETSRLRKENQLVIGLACAAHGTGLCRVQGTIDCLAASAQSAKRASSAAIIL